MQDSDGQVYPRYLCALGGSCKFCEICYDSDKIIENRCTQKKALGNVFYFLKIR